MSAQLPSPSYARGCRHVGYARSASGADRAVLDNRTRASVGYTNSDSKAAPTSAWATSRFMSFALNPISVITTTSPSEATDAKSPKGSFSGFGMSLRYRSTGAPRTTRNSTSNVGIRSTVVTSRVSAPRSNAMPVPTKKNGVNQPKHTASSLTRNPLPSSPRVASPTTIPAANAPRTLSNPNSTETTTNVASTSNARRTGNCVLACIVRFSRASSLGGRAPKPTAAARTTSARKASRNPNSCQELYRSESARGHSDDGPDLADHAGRQQ